MRVQFVERESRPERLVCEAEIQFEEDQLAGMRLVGFPSADDPYAQPTPKPGWRQKTGASRPVALSGSSTG